MNFEKAKKLLTQLSVFYFLLAAMIFFVAGDGFRHEIVTGSALSPCSVIGEIVYGWSLNSDCRWELTMLKH